MGTVPELLGLGPMGKEHSSSWREGKLWLGVAKSISDRSIEGQSPSLEVLNPRGASPDRDFGQFCSPELAHHQPLSTNRKEFLPSCPPGPSLAFTPTLTSSSSSSTAIPGGSQGPGAAPKTKFSISAFFCSPPSAALSLPLSFHPRTLPFAHTLAALHSPAPKKPPCDSSLLALLTPPKKLAFPPMQPPFLTGSRLRAGAPTCSSAPGHTQLRRPKRATAGTGQRPWGHGGDKPVPKPLHPPSFHPCFQPQWAESRGRKGLSTSCPDTPAGTRGG